MRASGKRNEQQQEGGPSPAVQQCSSLSRRGYGVPFTAMSPAELKHVMAELTMTPSTFGSGQGRMPGPPPQSFRVYRKSTSKLYVPRYYGLQRFGVPANVSLTTNGTRASPGRLVFTGNLRDEQRAPAAAFLEAAADPARLGGILALPCGFGKTVLALHLIAALGMRTIVVAHKEFLLSQWRDRIRQFLPRASVGLVKAGCVDVEGHDIVLASLQSLSMKQYPDDLFKAFGFVIIDECHRVGTEVFSRALFTVACPVTLGLSATVERKDGLTKAFVYFLGDVLFKVKRPPEQVQVAQVVFQASEADASSYRREVLLPGGKPNMSRMLNNIAYHAGRTQAICDHICCIIAAQPSRKVLVLSDRKSQLSSLHDMLTDPARMCRLTCGFYWGGMKPHDLAASERCQVMLATFAYAAEGMDVPGLDTLVLASPKTDIEQSCGRILRLRADQRPNVPLVLDVVDAFSVFSSQAVKRRRFYRRNGYQVHQSLQQTMAATLSHAAISDDTDGDECLPDADDARCQEPASIYAFVDDDVNS